MKPDKLVFVIIFGIYRAQATMDFETDVLEQMTTAE